MAGTPRWWLEVWDEQLGGFPGCDICGRADDIDLVDKDFDHFGFEEWEDLVPLCPDCRDAVAVHIHAAAARMSTMPYHLAFTAAAAAVRRART